MGVCVEKLPHVCSPEHTSQQGLQVFMDEDGNYNGYCYSCATVVPDPYKDKPAGYKPTPMTKSPEEIAQELWDISQCPVMELADRKLKQETLEYFGYRIELSSRDGVTPTIAWRPYTKDGAFASYKAKPLFKSKIRGWSVGDQKDVDLFGWEQAIRSGSPKLIITEGEEDAVALYQMIRRENANGRYADLVPAVTSIPHGAGAAVRDLTRLSAKIRRYFKEVILAFDMDKPGQKAAKAVVASVLGEAKIAELPEGDANACLIAGKSKAAVKAVLWQAEVPKNTRIVKGSELHELGRMKAQWGNPWPFEGLTRLTRGRRRGETIYIGAGVKMGKSELVDTIANQVIVGDNAPCFLAKPEQAMGRTYQMLVGKAAGRIFHDPTIEFDEEAYDAGSKLVGDKAIILDSYQFVNWDGLKEDIRYAVIAEGTQDVIIDPVTSLTAQMGSSEANEFLTGFAAELSSMAMDLDFTAYIFCHLKAPKDTPHERGGKVLSTQFAGSRAMMRSCNYMIGMEGNKDPDLSPEQRNFRDLVILEDREFGQTGRIKLWWDMHTGLFQEVK